MADTHEPLSEDEHRLFGQAGLWAVLGIVAVLIVAVSFFLIHRPHSVLLTPGQPQSSLMTAGGR
jgi:hypothetical protein